MNKLRGRVVGIESNGRISLVDVESGGDTFTATVLEAPDGAEYMKVGAEVALMFKETEVSLAKNLSGLISLRNRFDAIVSAIEQGDLISAVRLDYRGQAITSVVTTRAVRRLQLAVGGRVEALVKANEVMLGDWQ
jgi:molybdate transport system regulatory protein